METQPTATFTLQNRATVEIDVDDRNWHQTRPSSSIFGRVQLWQSWLGSEGASVHGCGIILVCYYQHQVSTTNIHG